MIRLDMRDCQIILAPLMPAEYRTGLQPLMTIEETKQYAIQAVTYR